MGFDDRAATVSTAGSMVQLLEFIPANSWWIAVMSPDKVGVCDVDACSKREHLID